MNGRADRPTVDGLYETEQQARADVAYVYERSRHSLRQSALAEANLAHLADACESAGVTLGAFDARIVTWLASWEPETCAVVAGLISRAFAAGAPDDSL
jgi:hypothetical protein